MEKKEGKRWKGRGIERKVERRGDGGEKRRFPLHWFTHSMLATARIVPGQS